MNNLENFPVKNALYPALVLPETYVFENQVRALSLAVAAVGCIYNGAGFDEPSRTGHFVYEMGFGEQLKRQIQMATLYRVFNEASLKLLQESEVQAGLGVTQQEVDLACETNPLAIPLVCYFGVDLCGPGNLINDLNTDRATIAGFQPEFAEVFERTFFEMAGHFRSFYHGFIPMLKEYSGKDAPRVYVLTEEEDPYKKANAKFAEKFGFSVGGISQFDHTMVDIVFRVLKTEVILRDFPKYQVLMDCLRGGLPMVNPLGSYLAGGKGWPAILSKLGYVDSEWFPNLWVVNPDSVTSKNGHEINSTPSEFLDSLVDSRSNFVAKKGFGAGGRGVKIGKEMKKWEWVGLINQIKGSKQAWIFEEIQPKRETGVVVGDWGRIGEKIAVIKKRLNIIERIYSTGPFGGMTAEVFGSPSWKVNASGYTFPVSFSPSRD